ncbi:MAG: MutS family DNA mismatch repair protein [Anaerolineae bacterium]|nr:MutS family DNA mismatch repair protein [Anaerolineae bacterium]
MTGALALLNIVLLVLGLARVIPMLCFGSFVIYVAVYAWSARGANTLIKAANTILDPLRNLGTVLGYLEKYRYGRNEGLHALCTPFVTGAHRPSAELRRLTWVVAGASIRGNPFLWILVNAVVPWDLFIAYLLERRKRALAQMVPQWLDVWYELEALCALANLAYLNPAYTFPCIVADGGAGEGQTAPALLEVRALGHPLIPEADRVCNDFAIAGRGKLALITGSNMSGKSTFLRTLGINLCLAYAGGPVNAQSLRTAPVRLFTVIRVTDSVSEGISYFYAEVKRLKTLLEALEAEHPAPVFYLIDEIFKGTNNRERLIGSRSYIRTLVRHNGLGALSTHDLELVSLADEIPQIKNYHFTESVADGRMHFDYTLRPGPSPTTNALKIMRMEGLPVEPPA